MNKYIQSLKSFHIPSKSKIKLGYNALTQQERNVFIICAIIAIASFLYLLYSINHRFTVSVPEDGGTMTEGIIGMPTLVNPVLAISDADKDVTTLVYSGLMRKVRNGVFIPDLAESYTVSPDGTRYTFILKSTATFQDGTPVTADDILFTINKIKDPLIKSPRKVEWEGVTVDATDAHTIVFTLKQPYASFLDNTTIGILPMNIWKNVSEAEFGLNALNIKGIGSGPYKIKSVTKDSEGIPTSYTLSRFKKFTLGAPHIYTINLTSYANEKELVDALTGGYISEAGGISPENAITFTKNKNIVVNTSPLPRMFGLFFNGANNSLLKDKNVIKGISYAIDRKDIIGSVLKGYGTEIDNPVPDTFIHQSP